MLGLVRRHELDHLIVERLLVLRLVQVDEVDDHDAPQVAQTQLTCDLLRRREVHVQGRLLLIVLGLGPVAGVDVDDVHRLRPLDDQVGTSFERHVLGEQRLDLLRDVEVVEDRNRALVELDDLLLLGLDLADVVADLVVHRLVIDGDLREGAVQRVADDRIGAVHLAHQLRRNLRRFFADRRTGLAPALDLRLDVVLDILVPGLHGRRADDDAEILRQHLRGNAFQTPFLFCRADLLRQEDLRGEGDQHHVAPRQRDVGGQTRALGRNGLFGHLDHDLLPHLQVIADLARFLHRSFELHGLDAHAALAGLLRRDEFLQRREMRSQIEVVDESILFVSYVDEGRIESRHDLADLSQIDVSHGEARLALLLVELDEHLVLAQGDGDLGRGDVYD